MESAAHITLSAISYSPSYLVYDYFPTVQYDKSGQGKHMQPLQPAET